MIFKSFRKVQRWKVGARVSKRLPFVKKLSWTNIYPPRPDKACDWCANSRDWLLNPCDWTPERRLCAVSFSSTRQETRTALERTKPPMKPRIFEIRKSKIPDETEDFCAFPSFLPRHTLSHSSAPSPATAAEPCWTFSLSQKTQGSLFSWAWRELSCKWEQRENLFSLCRAQPKVSKNFRTSESRGKTCFHYAERSRKSQKRTFMKDLIFKSFSQFCSDYQKETREGWRIEGFCKRWFLVYARVKLFYS